MKMHVDYKLKWIVSYMVMGAYGNSIIAVFLDTDSKGLCAL